MLLKEETLDYFEKVLNISIKDLINSYLLFMENYYPKIIGYYEENNKFDGISFSKLNLLQEEVNTCLESIRLNKNAFLDFASWDLFEQIEEVNEKLNSINHLYLYYNLAEVKNGSEFGGILREIPLKTKQTLESVTKELNISDSENNWQELAISNLIEEENYSSNGGILIKSILAQPTNQENNKIETILGELAGEKMYGRDLKSKLTFENQDILCLSPTETRNQKINILLNLKQNDNPEFPYYGVQSNLIVGNSISGLGYPSFFRQITETFKSDKSFSSIAIVELTNVKEAVKMQFELKTVYGDNLIQDSILI